MHTYQIQKSLSNDPSIDNQLLNLTNKLIKLHQDFNAPSINPNMILMVDKENRSKIYKNFKKAAREYFSYIFAEVRNETEQYISEQNHLSNIVFDYFDSYSESLTYLYVGQTYIANNLVNPCSPDMQCSCDSTRTLVTCNSGKTLLELIPKHKYSLNELFETLDWLKEKRIVTENNIYKSCQHSLKINEFLQKLNVKGSLHEDGKIFTDMSQLAFNEIVDSITSNYIEEKQPPFPALPPYQFELKKDQLNQIFTIQTECERTFPGKKLLLPNLQALQADLEHDKKLLNENELRDLIYFCGFLNKLSPCTEEMTILTINYKNVCETMLGKTAANFLLNAFFSIEKNMEACLSIFRWPLELIHTVIKTLSSHYLDDNDPFNIYYPYLNDHAISGVNPSPYDLFLIFNSIHKHSLQFTKDGINNLVYVLAWLKKTDLYTEKNCQEVLKRRNWLGAFSYMDLNDKTNPIDVALKQKFLDGIIRDIDQRFNLNFEDNHSMAMMLVSGSLSDANSGNLTYSFKS